MKEDGRGYCIDALSYSYGTASCLHAVTLRLRPGALYGLIGPNGSGKSTLLDLMAGHARTQQGSIRLHGIGIEDYGRRELARILSAVPQSFSLNFGFSVEEVVLMGRHPHIPRLSRPGAEDWRQVDRALELMDIAHLRQRPVMHLSGGEKQRVMVARSMAQNTEIILLDEVTANLDIHHAISIMKTMSTLVAEQGRTVVAALHDLNMAAAFCDELIVLRDGRLVQFGPAAEVISAELISEIFQVPVHISATAGGRNLIRFTYQ